MWFGQLKRRDFITLVGGAAAWPLMARAQQPAKAPRIGMLYPGPQAAVAVRVESMLKAFAAAGQRAGALLMLSSPLFGSSTRTVAEVALRRNLPAITLFPDFARAGGLLAYGPNLRDMYRQSGVIIGKVLQGRKPADLPIERPHSSNWW